MTLPIQAPPVIRSYTTAKLQRRGVGASGEPACSICHAACNALPWPANIACNLICDRTAC